MSDLMPEAITVSIDAAPSVNGLLIAPSDATACFVFAHGAGAGMAHPFMAAFAAGLADRRVATLRYQFPSMERGSKRPDSPAVAHAAVRAAVADARQRCTGLALVAGGKSFGGRMTSQAQAERALPGVVGLAFIGFPLHPPGKPSDQRAEHLSRVDLPMLFLQGTRDELADLGQLQPVLARLGSRATPALFEDADHSFHVRSRSGRNDREVMTAMLDAFACWLASIGANR